MRYWAPSCVAEEKRAGASGWELVIQVKITSWSEGAFVLARAQRSTEALEVAGEFVARAVQSAIER